MPISAKIPKREMTRFNMAEAIPFELFAWKANMLKVMNAA
jgi:hypothetical protein